MKNTKNTLSLLGLSAFLLVSTLSVKANPLEPTNSFTQWCTQKNSLPIATHRTIELLLQRAGTTDCQKADTNLSSLNKLDLSDTKM
jgi:internalin A